MLSAISCRSLLVGGSSELVKRRPAGNWEHPVFDLTECPAGLNETGSPRSCSDLSE